MSIDTTRFKLELRFLILEDLMAFFLTAVRVRMGAPNSWESPIRLECPSLALGRSERREGVNADDVGLIAVTERRE